MKKQHLTYLFMLLGLQTMSQSINNINEIIVTENRNIISRLSSNRQVIIIDQEEIKNGSSHTLAELLENTAGIDIRSRGAFGAQADIQFRGGTFEQTLILLNGVKFSDPQTGHHLLNLPVSLLDIERIEILKGAAARIYGQNAYAGVINIITRKPNGNSLRADLSQGQYGLQEQIVSSELETGSVKNRLSLSRLKTDGYKPNTDLDQQQVYYQSAWQTQNTQWDLSGGYLNKKFGANGFYTAAFPWQYEELESANGVLGVSKSNWLHLKGHLMYRRMHDMFQLKRDTPSFSQNLHQTDVYSADVSIGNKNKWGYWNTGAEFRSEQIASSNLGNHTRNISSVFAEQQVYLRKFSFVPGFCVNNYSDYGWVAYPGIDLGYRHRNWGVSASTQRTFRVPTYTELYYTDGAKSSLGNSSLKPEQAWSHELNIRYQRSYFRIQAAAFNRMGSQQIDWIKDSATAPSWQAVNLGEINTQGGDIQLTFYPQIVWKNLPLTKIEMAYCRVDVSKASSPDVVSRYVSDYLRNQFTSTLHFQFIRYLHTQLRIRYEDRTGNTLYSPFWLCDIKVAYNSKHYMIFAEGSNLFNQQYYDVNTALMPGRWLRAGVSLQVSL